MTSLGRNDRLDLVEAFRRGLLEAGYIDGRNVNAASAAKLAADQIGRKCWQSIRLVFANRNSIASVHAAKASTATIPIMFVTGGDPIQEGFVASLNRPGSNLTGVT